MCVTDRHHMTLPVKVALNPNTSNQPITIVYVQSSKKFRLIKLARKPCKNMQINTVDAGDHILAKRHVVLVQAMSFFPIFSEDAVFAQAMSFVVTIFLKVAYNT